MSQITAVQVPKKTAYGVPFDVEVSYTLGEATTISVRVTSPAAGATVTPAQFPADAEDDHVWQALTLAGGPGKQTVTLDFTLGSSSRSATTETSAAPAPAAKAKAKPKAKAVKPAAPPRDTGAVRGERRSTRRGAR